jgi:hypothetical protein
VKTPSLCVASRWAYFRNDFLVALGVRHLNGSDIVGWFYLAGGVGLGLFSLVYVSTRATIAAPRAMHATETSKISIRCRREWTACQSPAGRALRTWSHRTYAQPQVPTMARARATQRK